MKIYEASLTYKTISDGKAEVLNTPERVVAYLHGAFDFNPEIESFWVIILNRKNYAKGRMLITVGTASNSLVHPREVFRAAVMESASAIIVAHNHPSGDPTPSAADIQITRQLRDAAKALCIDLLDHTIIGQVSEDPQGKGYYSFRNAGLV